MMMGTKRVVSIVGGGGNLVYFTDPTCAEAPKNIIIFVGGYDSNKDRSGAEVTLEKLAFELEDLNINPDQRTVHELIEVANLEIVFVDWADGGARLQDNGQVVANAIKTINADKTARGITIY